MNYKYYVAGKFYDNGKTQAEILTKEQAAEKNYINGLFEEHESFDLYVDGFDTMKEAKEHIREILEA